MKSGLLTNLVLVAEDKDGDNIPEWLLVEVLIRLPVKLIFRLKLVSKRWLSVISHPSFRHVYVRQYLSFPELQRWTFLSQYMHLDGSDISNEVLIDMYSCDLEIPSLYALPFPCTQQPQEIKYKIFGASNGLVLYGPMTLVIKHGNCLDRYCICNPATGEWIALPPQSSHFVQLTDEVTGFLTRTEGNILKSYRVVCLQTTVLSKAINLEVFISETSEWKEYVFCLDHGIWVESYKSPTVLKGSLYWMTRKHGLLAYNPYQTPNSVSFIPLPNDRNPRFDYGRSIPSKCDAHQGQLRYLEVSRDNIPPLGFSGIRVWTLTDCKTGDWSLMHKINLADISCDASLSGQDLDQIPLSFHPFDSNILYFGCSDAILSYDFENRKIDAHGDPSNASMVCNALREWDPAGWSTLKFVIPPWPISITSPEIQD